MWLTEKKRKNKKSSNSECLCIGLRNYFLSSSVGWENHTTCCTIVTVEMCELYPIIYWLLRVVHLPMNKSVLNVHWKDWCWSWSSNTLATWCEDLTHWKRRWCWETLKEGGERDDRGWGGWMASPTQWTWVWASSGSWWWTGRPGVLQPMGLQRVGHDWATELNWTVHLPLI